MKFLYFWLYFCFEMWHIHTWDSS